MLKTILVFIALAAIGKSVKAQMLSNGPCPNVTVISTFNRDKYLGRWYTVRANPEGEPSYKCVSSRYSKDGDNLKDYTNRIYQNNCTLCLERYTPIVYDVQILNGGELRLYPENSPFPYNHPDIPNYSILGTDYDNYSTAYSCFYNEEDDTKLQTMWILTRSKRPSDNVLNEAISNYEDNGLDISVLKKVPQSPCPIKL